MVVSVSIIWPNRDDAWFDMDYYTSKHIPLANNKMKQYGLKYSNVLQFSGTVDGKKSPFTAESKLVFETIEGFRESFAVHGDELLGDLENFTNLEPYMVLGDLVTEASL